MPEINHKAEPMAPPQAPKTPEQLSKEAQERIDLARAQASKQAGESTPQAPVQASVPEKPPIDPRIAGLTSEQLEEYILGIVAKSRAARQDAQKPQEPDWATLTEAQALDLKNPVYIPLIEHDVPAYMDVQLADPEYMPVWANMDQRRVGQLLAEGYEFLTKDHVAKGFKLPLKFDSEGMYRYHDTVCMRVHKRIILSKRRAVVNRSLMQLKSVDRVSADALRKKVIEQDPELEHAMDKGSLTFY